MSDPRSTRRAILRRTGAALGVIGTAGCLGNRSSTAQEISMAEGFAFAPATATIDRGGTVIWRNTDTVDHTVTAYEDRIPDGAAYFASGGFDSERAARDNLAQGLVGPGETYAHTFERSGEYEYFCIPHEGSGMVGTVRVR